MKIISVENTLEDLKRRLSPIRDEFCIIHNRSTKKNLIVVPGTHADFISSNFDVIEMHEFTNEFRINLHDVLDGCLIVGEPGYIS